MKVLLRRKKAQLEGDAGLVQGLKLWLVDQKPGYSRRAAARVCGLLLKLGTAGNEELGRHLLRLLAGPPHILAKESTGDFVLRLKDLQPLLQFVAELCFVDPFKEAPTLIPAILQRVFTTTSYTPESLQLTQVSIDSDTVEASQMSS